MKLPIELPVHSIIRQKREVALNFSISLKIAPQTKQAVEIDKMMALRMFVIMRTWLFNWSKPFRENDKKTIRSYKTLNDSELIGMLNLQLYDAQKYIRRKPNNEEQFNQVFNSIVNVFCLFILENIKKAEDKKLFASAFLQLLDKFELVLGPIEIESLSNYLEKLSTQEFSKPEKEEVEEEPELSGTNEEVSSNIIEKKENESKEDENKLLSRKEVAGFYGISLTSLWRWEMKGSIPKPIRIGGKSFWRKSDILDDLTTR